MQPERAIDLFQDGEPAEEKARFSVVEGVGSEEPFKEAELVSIEEAVEMSSDPRAAERFLQLMANEFIAFVKDPDKKKGYYRETAHQNKLARAFYNGQLSDIDKVFLFLKKNVEGNLRSRGYDLESRQRAVSELDDTRVGIRAMLQAVEKSKQDFARNAGPDQHQLIAINDIHDATSAIDYFDIRYTDTGVAEVVLVQAKASVAKVTGDMDDLARIRARKEGLREHVDDTERSHRKFVEALPGMQQLATEAGPKMLEHVRAFRDFSKELEAAESPAELHEYMVEKMSDLILEYILEPVGEMEEGEHDELISSLAEKHELTTTHLATIFGGPRAGVLFNELSVRSGAADEVPEWSDQAYSKLRAWALANQPGFLELLPLDEEWPQVKEWLGAIKISSRFSSPDGDHQQVIFQAQHESDVKILTKRAS